MGVGVGVGVGGGVGVCMCVGECVHDSLWNCMIIFLQISIEKAVNVNWKDSSLSYSFFWLSYFVSTHRTLICQTYCA